MPKKGNIKDLAGQRFGKLIAIKHIGFDKNRRAIWLCICDCGNTIEKSNILSSNGARSCGCIKKEGLKHGYFVDGTKSKYRSLTNCWKSLIHRCYNPNNKSFYRYGGRGITVCEEWLDKSEGLQNFINWALGHNWQKGLTIDRTDNNLGYSPNNCKWENKSRQQRNKETSLKVEYEGNLISIWDFIDQGLTNIPYVTLQARMRKKGITIEEALAIPYKDRGKGNVSRK